LCFTITPSAPFLPFPKTLRTPLWRLCADIFLFARPSVVATPPGITSFSGAPLLVKKRARSPPSKLFIRGNRPRCFLNDRARVPSLPLCRLWNNFFLPETSVPLCAGQQYPLRSSRRFLFPRGPFFFYGAKRTILFPTTTDGVAFFFFPSCVARKLPGSLSSSIAANCSNLLLDGMSV